jgi:alpha-N-arabinofuranosidase
MSKTNITEFKRSFDILVSILVFFGISFSQGYRNPIIPGFHPDPSVVRVGEDYYLVNSSFEYFPGVPIFHSRDLINWKQIGHVLTRRSQLPLDKVRPSDGIYAPTIRYHDGVFYMVTTLVGDGRFTNFYVTTKDPAGQWSDPIYYDQSGIDPSLFWDDDGKVYFHSNRAMKFSDPRGIYVSETDIKTGKRLTEPRLVWKGSGGSYPEGPHIYKRNGIYYLIVAEGGTAYGHMVTLARSKHIYGPYEAAPNNPILSNRYAYSSVQGTGHADLVEAHDGSWWLVHLAFRPTIGEVHTIGRETFLTPAKWDADGWLVVNETGTTAEEMKVPTLPLRPFPKTSPRDDFDSSVLGFDWIHLRNPEIRNYSLSEKKGSLRLKGGAATLYDLDSPTFVGRRQDAFIFQAETRVDFRPAAENEEAGMTLLMTNQHHYDLFIRRSGGKLTLVVKFNLELIKHTAAEIPLEDRPVRLRVAGTKEFYTFSYAQRDNEYKEIAKVNTRYLGTEVTGGYNGVIIGLYATGNGKPSTANADFDWFGYETK